LFDSKLNGRKLRFNTPLSTNELAEQQCTDMNWLLCLL